MITLGHFGQPIAPPANASTRLPFKAPRPANPNRQVNVPRTRFSTHLTPWEQALPGTQSLQPRIGSRNKFMRPGVVPSADPMPPRRPRRAAGGMQPGQVVARMAPNTPAAKPTAGYLGAGPYTGMTSGDMIPFRQSNVNIRQGIVNAPAIVKGAHAPGFPFVANSAGGYRFR